MPTAQEDTICSVSPSAPSPAERRWAAFAALGCRLNAARTPKEAAQIIVEVADQLLGWNSCTCDLYSADEDVFIHILNADLVDGRRTEVAPAFDRKPPSPTARRALQEGAQLILRQPGENFPAGGRAFGDHSRPSASLLFVPIRNGAKAIGLLSIQSYTPNAYDQGSLETLQALADHCGGALDRLRAEAELRAVQERLQQQFAELTREREMLRCLFDLMPDTIYFKDRQSRFVRCSKSFSRFVQFTDETSLLGKTDADLFSEEHARQAFEDEQQIIRTGQGIIGKLEKETYHDGRITWVLTTKLPWRDRDGNIIGTFGISKDVTALKEAEAKLEETHKQLLTASRQAGMAEIATSVLHNVGNVLNSVKVSTTLLHEQTRHSMAGSLRRAAALLRKHQNTLAEFLTGDPKGRQLVPYLEQLGEHLAQEQAARLQELESVSRNVQHIEEIVAVQQNYARLGGLTETVKLSDLVEDALRINSGALTRHGVQICRQYDPGVPAVTVEKHKVLQILVNLISNAKYACDGSSSRDKRLGVRVVSGDGRVSVSVMDNGIGIAPENLTRIFNHGFTTRKEGHGFGLHSAALAAREMGGSLLAYSDGPGHGATFTLEIPLLT